MAEKNQRIRVLRNFWHQNKQIGIGSVLDIAASTAYELRSAQKAEIVQADTPLVANDPPPKKPRPPSNADALLATLVTAVQQQGELLERLVAALDKKGKG